MMDAEAEAKPPPPPKPLLPEELARITAVRDANPLIRAAREAQRAIIATVSTIQPDQQTPPRIHVWHPSTEQQTGTHYGT